MICLNCVRGRERDKSICKYCGECNHLCKMGCSGRVRVLKINSLTKEKKRTYYARISDPGSPNQPEI